MNHLQGRLWIITPRFYSFALANEDLITKHQFCVHNFWNKPNYWYNECSVSRCLFSWSQIAQQFIPIRTHLNLKLIYVIVKSRFKVTIKYRKQKCVIPFQCILQTCNIMQRFRYKCSIILFVELICKPYFKSQTIVISTYASEAFPRYLKEGA